MSAILANSFTASLAKLGDDEQKQVKLTAFDLQLNPASPGLRLHGIDRSRDPSFWSVRVNQGLRIIVHKTAKSFLLAYVDHHDKAYAWAERRRIEAHPRTGAIQIVEVRETVEEISPAPSLVFDGQQVPQAEALLFAGLSEDDLLQVGVPADWIADVLQATEGRFLDLADHLPEEAAEALLEYAAGGPLAAAAASVPAASEPVDVAFSARMPDELEVAAEFQGPAGPDPFQHPDALRRFRVVENREELERALEHPFEKWTVFLHPSQRNVVERSYSGPARVAGSAGTGKTVVALHRAARLARDNPDGRILLTTFSRPLAAALERKLKILLGPQSGIVPRITVAPWQGIAEELYQLAFGRRPHVASRQQVRSALVSAARSSGTPKFSERFLLSEWTHVVDAWQIDSAESYAEVPRLGRKNRLGARQRERLWPILDAARTGLRQKGLTTWPQIFAAVATHYADESDKPFSHIVVDEAQDLGVPELRFLGAVAPEGPDALFFSGDLGQRIFQQPFSWKALGVDVRGRSQTLKVNYRTSHQIRQMADRMMPKVVRDVDGIEEVRTGTVSVFNGPPPLIELHENADDEVAATAAFISAARSDEIAPHEIGVFVRASELLPRARAAVTASGETGHELTEVGEQPSERIPIGTMHLAKGLEFKAVVVLACDDEVLPLQVRIEAVGDEIELDDVYETERQLLYVACTRARDRLYVSGVKPGSEFLADLLVRPQA